jgi:2-(1,2-epoxy-1,2-dihydrophenyl)acetyl-CoA isomerase
LQFALAANPENPGDSFLALTEVLHGCIQQIREMSKPVIAAINGPAAGAGLFLALACDFRLMADSAYLKQANTSQGLSIPAGGTFTLPRLVGLARALEIALLDERIFASRAFELGLVNRVTPETGLLDEARTIAYRMAQMPVKTLGRVKRLMNQAFDVSLEEQLQQEQQEIAESANSVEGREGITAFLGKRRPDYVNFQEQP